MILRDWLKTRERLTEIFVDGVPQPIGVYLKGCGLLQVRAVITTSDTLLVHVPAMTGDRKHLMQIESRTGSTLFALKDGEELIAAVCTRLKGYYADGSHVALALHRLDWAGYCPVIDGAMKLTGEWTIAAPVTQPN